MPVLSFIPAWVKPYKPPSLITAASAVIPPLPNGTAPWRHIVQQEICISQGQK